MQDTTNIFDVLAESLSVYGQTIRRAWRGLLAVIVQMELLRYGVRVYSVKAGILCGKGLPLDNLVSIVLSLTIGLVASALAVRTALLLFDRHETSARPNASGGLWHTWRRLFLTANLLCVIWVAFIVMLSVGFAGCLILVRSPLAQISSTVRWSLLWLGIAMELGIASLAVWLFVRWMFAPVLSIVRPVCGSSALRLSSDFVKGRFGCCISYFLLVILVSSGICMIPSLIATSGLLFRANALTGPFAPLLSVAVDLVKLYPVIALLVFWFRKSGCTAGASVNGPWRRRAGIALSILGLGSFMVYAFLVVRTFSQTRAITRQPREETLAQLYGSLSPKNSPSHRPTATGVTGANEGQSNDEPLPAFDASTITGDGLCALLGRSVNRLSYRQCSDLQRRLAGRKLTLHNLQVDGREIARCGGKATGFCLILRPMLGGHIAFRVSFAKKEDESMAKRLSSDFRNSVAELVGTVVDDSTEREANAAQSILKITAEKIVPRNPLEKLPPFNPNKVTADDLMSMSASLTNGLTNALIDDLLQKIEGQELSFTNLIVTGYHKSESGYGILRATVRTGYSPNQQLHLCVKVSAADVAALPWGFSRNCRIRRLSGKAVPRSVVLGEDCVYGYLGEITLDDATFEAGWETGKLPEFDAESITGDEFIALVSRLDASHRAAQARRMVQKLSTRRLSFSECEILERNVWSLDGRHAFRLGFGGKDSHGHHVLECDSIVRKGDRRVDDLGIGVRLKGVSGILNSDQDLNHISNVCLKDMTFETTTQTESLPAIDPNMLTGNELVRILAARKTSLSLSEVRQLQKSLAGRNLTIDLTMREFRRYLLGYSESNNGVRELYFSFLKRDRGLHDRSVVCRLRDDIQFSWDSIITRQKAKWRLTATVAPLHRTAPEYRWLVLEDASIEDISNKAK